MLGFRKKLPVSHDVVPKHLAIIMDGNGRWAAKRGMPRQAGHAAGVETLKTIARYCNSIGIQYLTLYAFSTENWKRPKEEVDGIMNLLKKYLSDILARMYDDNMRIRFIGELDGLSSDLRQLALDVETLTKDHTGLTVNFALNYGSRREITRAAQMIAQKASRGELSPEELDEQAFSGYLYTSGQPDPDLIIRPSGEYRVSNFLLWQAAYAELWFCDTLWPDFKPDHIDQAIRFYSGRNRRFGDVK